MVRIFAIGDLLMFFTRTGRVLAWLAIAMGCFGIALALIALQTDDPSAFMAEYFGRKSTGTAIDQGIYTIIFGIVVGILTDISRSVAKAKTDAE